MSGPGAASWVVRRCDAAGDVTTARPPWPCRLRALRREAPAGSQPSPNAPAMVPGYCVPPAWLKAVAPPG